MDARIRLLVEIVEQGYTAPSWHGTPLAGALRGLTVREALWRPGKARHNIWELALHAAYWKYIVRRRILRDPTVTFPREPANWPALPRPANAAAWKRDRALLADQHRRLVQAIRGLPGAQLERRGWRSKWRTKQEIYGIASHDLYHAGQIQLIKRLL